MASSGWRAAGAAVWLRAEDLQCSICLGLLSRPATLLCGHSFCLECIGRWAEAKAGGQGSGCPNCQRGFLKRLPQRNVLLEALIEQYRRAAKPDAGPEQGAAAPQVSLPGRAQAASPQWPSQAQEMVKISEISKEIELSLKALASRRRESTGVKDYVSRSRTSVIENFLFLKKYINDQEETVLKVIDEEYKAAQQKIDVIDEQLRARVENLLELQNNSEQLLQTTSAEQEVYFSSPVSMNEVTLDLQKISNISYAVEELKNMLEKSMLGTYLGQLLQESSAGTSKINEMEMDMDMELDESISPSSSSWKQDSLQEPGSCSSTVASTRSSAMLIDPKQFSQWASNVTFDRERIHPKLELSEDKKRVTVSQFSNHYRLSTRRFRISQVMGSPGFSKGCHYWQVGTKNCNAWAVGVADGKIGRDDLLGRTKLSWCIEWSKKGLLACHNNREIQIKEERPLQIGVFLDIPRNTLSFYSFTNTGTLLHQFNINVFNPVYPAFWLYGTNIGGALTINDIERD